MIAVEEKHYDDEKAAEQELARLNDLIGQIEDEIDEMKHAAVGRERRFAVVPLRDRRSGTVAAADLLRVPRWRGRAAAGGDRAVLGGPRRSRVQQPGRRGVACDRPLLHGTPPRRGRRTKSASLTRLLVVRPDGVDAYYGARAALETAGVDYGYQPIGEDWELEYGAPNPVLAQWIDDAIVSARDERRGLAQIVPQLAQQLAGAGLPAARGTASGVYAPGGAYNAGAGEAGIRVSRSKPGANNPFDGLRIEGSLPSESADPSGYGGLLVGDPNAVVGGRGRQGGPMSGGPEGVAGTAGEPRPSGQPDATTSGKRTGAAGGQDGNADQPSTANVLAAAGSGDQTAPNGDQPRRPKRRPAKRRPPRATPSKGPSRETASRWSGRSACTSRRTVSSCCRIGRRRPPTRRWRRRMIRVLNSKARPLPRSTK